MKAVILTADKFEDLEVFFPYFRLLEEGLEVDVAAPEKGEIHGIRGYDLEIDKTFKEVNPDDYDVLILPGGPPDCAPITIRNNQSAQSIAKSFFAANKLVAAICNGPYTLVSAGLVKGRKLTSCWENKLPEEIKKAGGKHVDMEVVVDGNLITSRYPGDLPYFMREMLKMIRKIKPVPK